MDRKFTLGCDIDGICCDWLGGCAFSIAKEYGLNLWSYLNGNKHSDEIEELLIKYQFTTEMYAWLNPIPYAAKYLNKFQCAGMEIIYITSRPPSTKAVTKQWLDLHGFPQGRVINVRVGKVPAVKRAGVNLFIEDRPKYANPLAEVGVNVVLLNNYGNVLGQIHEDIKIVTSWHAIDRLLYKERNE